MVYDRAIVGAGSAAAVYLCYYPVQTGKETVIVIGEPEPWTRRGGHRMGQPPQLLELPMALDESSYFAQDIGSHGVERPVTPMKAPSRVPRLIRHYEQLKESGSSPEDPFLRSSRYASSVQQIIGRYTPVADRVTSISGGDGSYRLALKGGDAIEARRVIIASGPGSVRPSAAYNPAYDGNPQLFASGEQFLDEDIRVKPGGVVCVEGGSATAAWAVEKALLGKAKGVFWFHRSSQNQSREKRFEEAFPAGGRNDWLRKHEDKITWCLADVASSAPRGMQIEVTFKNGVRVTCDQYVAAIGADGALNLLGDLGGTLKEIIDVNGHLDPDKQAVLGLGNEDLSLLAVGSAIYKSHTKYSSSNKYLPTAARPPEGIPTIIATIGALRRTIGGGNGKLWVDFNLQSFTDLDEYFFNTVQYFLAAGFSDGLDGLGEYTAKQVAQFVTDQVIGTRIMKSSSFGVSEAEMHNVFLQIWDFAYKTLGTKRLEEWGPLLKAYYS
jgi:hypothetical protein